MCMSCRFEHFALQNLSVSTPLMCKRCRKHFAGDCIEGGSAICPRCGTEWVNQVTPEVESTYAEEGIKYFVVRIHAQVRPDFTPAP